VILLVVIGATGFFYCRHQRQQLRSDTERQLLAITELKVDELAQWRKECLSDGGVLLNNSAFVGLVQRFLQQPQDQDAQLQLQAWLDKYGQHFRYDQMRLLDTNGVTRLSSPAGLTTVSAVVVESAAEALRTGRVTLQDFYRTDTDGTIQLAVLVPVIDVADGKRPLGVLVMRIDPATYLYPFIQRWPVPSATAETLLVRREGDEVVFLNDLRFKKDAALTMRASLTNTGMPAVMAALGHEGIMEGVDYRGVSVIAALSSIPDSPWCMVARQDVSEVVAPLHTLLWQVIFVVGALMFSAGAGLGLVWRQQSVRFYRNEVEVMEQLQVSEQRYLTLFSTMSEGFCVIEVLFDEHNQPNDYRFLELNPAFEAQSGLRNAVGKRIREIAPHNEAHWFELYGQVAISGVPIRFEHEAKALHRWFSVSAYRVGGQDSRKVGIIFDNITERKQAEAELQAKNAELERFLYAASHDLKSPVVTVNAYLSYLEQDMATGDAGRIEKDMRFIRAATAKMVLLLEDMLNIASVGHAVGPPVSVTFRDLVDDALGAVAGRIAERKVTVEVGEHAATLFGERLRLAEIWQNLVENACKFMGDQPAPRIVIGVETRGAETVFFVRDNGIGLDPRYHDRIFNLFEKLDPSVEGTGLGLALVKRIIELYHGRIWIESHGAGQGTCFLFTLPAALEHAPPMQSH
jgi:PAS domain S-box-containing protein